jgi:hypothetical protein
MAPASAPRIVNRFFLALVHQRHRCNRELFACAPSHGRRPPGAHQRCRALPAQTDQLLHLAHQPARSLVHQSRERRTGRGEKPIHAVWETLSRQARPSEPDVWRTLPSARNTTFHVGVPATHGISPLAFGSALERLRSNSPHDTNIIHEVLISATLPPVTVAQACEPGQRATALKALISCRGRFA